MKEKKGTEMLVAMSVVASAGITLCVWLGVGIAIGYYVDRWIALETPWGLLIGGVLGAVIGFMGLLKRIMDAFRD